MRRIPLRPRVDLLIWLFTSLNKPTFFTFFVMCLLIAFLLSLTIMCMKGIAFSDRFECGALEERFGITDCNDSGFY